MACSPVAAVRGRCGVSSADCSGSCEMVPTCGAVAEWASFSFGSCGASATALVRIWTRVAAAGRLVAAAEAGRSACCACVSIDHMALAEVDSASWCACGRIAEALCARFSDILAGSVGASAN